jgi:hypothetical protein
LADLLNNVALQLLTALPFGNYRFIANWCIHTSRKEASFKVLVMKMNQAAA